MAVVAVFHKDFEHTHWTQATAWEWSLPYSLQAVTKLEDTR